jgi:hypothetical protein
MPVMMRTVDSSVNEIIRIECAPRREGILAACASSPIVGRRTPVPSGSTTASKVWRGSARQDERRIHTTSIRVNGGLSGSAVSASTANHVGAVLPCAVAYQHAVERIGSRLSSPARPMRMQAGRVGSGMLAGK